MRIFGRNMTSGFSLTIICLRKRMANTNITLKCLIIPSGYFNALSLNDLSLRITLPRNGAVYTLQTAIQNQFEPSYNNYPLDIRQVYYSGSGEEESMRVDAKISAYSKVILQQIYFI